MTREPVNPPVYERMTEAMEAVDRLQQIERMGNQVIALKRAKVLSEAAGTALLSELLRFYASPLEHSEGVVRVSRELRRYA